MKAPLFPILVVGLMVAGCGKKEPATEGESATNAAASGNPITAPVDYIGAVGAAQRHSVKVIDTVQVQQTIRQFNAIEGRYPKTLNELVTMNYYPKLPQLPRGMRYDYDPKTGQVKAVRQP